MEPGLRGALFLALLAAGCAPALTSLGPGGLPDRARVPGVPVVVQAEHHCGPASLSALLAWAGRPESPEALAGLVYLPGRAGTLPIDLSREIRARGLLAYRVPARLDALLAEVAAGHPSVVLENRGLGWVPLWHYSVLVGYDLTAGELVFHAGGPDPEAITPGRFAHTWTRGGAFALLALPPGRLPANDDPEGILAALAELEDGGQARAAAAGYGAFVARWPGDWRGAFGLGNARFALGDRAGAGSALAQAHAAAPHRPEPLNNLALLAHAAGRAEEAEAAARRAVAAAQALGLDPAAYRQTLGEVSAAPP